MAGVPKLDFICPTCGAENLYREVDPGGESTALACAHCETVHPLEGIDAFRETGFLSRCLVCGAPDLYVQRDFDRRLGCLVILVAVALSYPTRGLSLIIAVFADYLLYHLLPEITICYRCHAVYRNVERNPSHAPFDPAVGEKYEVEASGYRNPRVPRTSHRAGRKGPNQGEG